MNPTRRSSSRKISIIGPAALLAQLEARGIPREEGLRGTGITEAMLADPYATIAPEQEFAFVRNFIRCLGHPAPGIFAGSHYRLSTLGMLGTALTSNATVGEVIRFFLKYIHLSYTYFAVAFEVDEGAAALTLSDQTELGDLRRYFLDRDVAFVFSAARDAVPFVDLDKLFRQVAFAYPAPADLAPYRAYFPCEVVFDAPVTRVVTNPAILASPMPQANPLTLKMLEEQCRRLSLEYGAGQGWAERVRGHLRARPGRFPDMDETAKRFGCTPRTLRRHLLDEGTSFQELLDEVRAGISFHYLAHTALSVEQIAQQVGYAETSAFIAAFRRWTGKTPTRYRDESRLGG